MIKQLKRDLLYIINTSLYNEHSLNTNHSIKKDIHIIHQLKEQLDGHLSDKELQDYANATKSRIQFEANQAIDNNDGFGLLAMATATGKSKVAINKVDIVCTNFQPKYTLSIPKILLVVPTEKLRDEGWKNEFSKWNMSILWDKYVERTCYASLDKYKDGIWDLVILDECHNITENNSVFFDNNKVLSCIGLTATPPTNKTKIQILEKIGLKTVYTITLDEAIDLGIVAPYDITIVTVPLDNVNKYIKSGKDKPFYQTETSKYEYLTRCVEFGTNPHKEINRMRFIYTLRSKTVTAINILNHIIRPQNKRTLIFCGSKDQANEVSPYRYYSKPVKPRIPSKLKTRASQSNIAIDYSLREYQTYLEKLAKYEREILFYQGNESYEKFVNQEINEMSCCEAINEGHNIPNVDCALIIQLNSQGLDFIQRLGRILRFRVGHIGRVIVIVAENTVDEIWAAKATLGFNLNKIRWIKLDDLRNAKETINFN